MASKTAGKTVGTVAAFVLAGSVFFAGLVAMFGWNAAHVPCEAPDMKAMDASGRQALITVAIAHAIFGVPALIQLLVPSSLGVRIGALVCAICACITVFLAACWLLLVNGLC